MIGGSNPKQERDFALFKNAKIGSAAHPTSYSMGIWSF
jgi:hypothetical protein